MGADDYYFDTSALFKRYIVEPGTELVDKLFSTANMVFISNLTIVEFISNLKRLTDIDGIIDHRAFEAIKNEFFNEISGGVINIESLTSSMIVNAAGLLENKYITPIDSLQLSTALALKKKYQDLKFVSADYKLSVLAEEYGLKVIYIEKASPNPANGLSP